MAAKIYEVGGMAKTLKEQGFEMAEKDHLLSQRMIDGLNLMHIQGAVTEKEYDRIMDRVWKWCQKQAKKARGEDQR